MARAIPIKVGDETFPSKVAVTRQFRQIAERTPDEQPLVGPDAGFVDALFRMHPEYADRTAFREVAHYTISHAKGGSRCLYVRYRTGELQDFSLGRCLDHL